MTVDHPAILALLPLAIIAYVLYAVRMKRALSWGNASPVLWRRLYASAALRVASFALLAVALAGVHIKGRNVPHPLRHVGGKGTSAEAGDAVSLVFDISYSMNAMDGAGTGAHYKVSRMDAASLFCSMLLPSLRGKPISVVLAKGDGVVAVPLTEDYESVEQCLGALSSTLMSAEGTNLAAGIHAASLAFPDNAAFARHIWLFTDGDETAGSVSAEAQRAASEGASVVLVGVGSVEGAEVTAGDGKTKVHTALREDALKAFVGGNVHYIAAAQSGAAAMLLATLNEHTGGGVVSIHPRNRGRAGALDNPDRVGSKSILALAAVVMFALSEVIASGARRRVEIAMTGGGRRHSLVVGALLLSSILAGCSSRSAAGETISGAWAWHQGRMQRSTACFLRALQYSREAGDEEGAQYALYNTAAAYIAMNEYDAALSRMDEAAEDAPLAVRYAAAYNRGVIAMGRGEYGKAVTAFRRALMVDGTRLEAKENLEIANDALHQTSDDRRGCLDTPPQQMRAGALGNPDTAAQEMFDRVREQDKKQWQAREQENTAPSHSADY